MNNELELSEKSKTFLENLRLYLFSNGKNSDEIEDIVEELEAHLLEAEKNGKPIEKIIGNSPNEYMQMVSNEMPIDLRTWTKYIFLIIFGSFSFTIFSDLTKGNLSYSVLEIAGHLLFGAIFIVSVIMGFKYISTSNLSFFKQGLLLSTVMILPITLFIGLIFLNKAIDTPTIYFGSMGSWMIGIMTALFLIGTSIWAKTWILVFVVTLFTLPDYVLSKTALNGELQLVISPWISLIGLVGYFFIWFKLEKGKVSS